MKKRLTQLTNRLLDDFDFQAIGEDAQGVPSYAGSLPPAFLCWMSVCVGLGFLLITCVMMQPLTGEYIVSRSWVRAGLVGGILLVMGKTLGSATWLLRFHRRLSRLTPQEQVRRQWGLTQEELRQLANAKSVKPRCNFNGEDYYDLGDFGDAVTLLRASAQPIASQEMLRPVLHTSLSPEELLRATRSESEET